MIAFLHLILIIIAQASPWLVPWWVIAPGTVVLSVQYLLIGGCVLTHDQFGKIPYNYFHYHYLVRFFPHVSRLRYG